MILEDQTEGGQAPSETAAPAAPAEPQGRERELKFEVEAESLAPLRRLLARLEGATRRARKSLTSVYFDTEAFALRDADVTLRIRRDGARRLQTLKHGAGGFGLFDRLEIERPAGSAAPRLTEDEKSALSAVLGDWDEPPLAPAFKTVVKRAVYDVLRGGASIEVALDDAAVEGAGRRAAFCELELELRSGDPAELFRLARELASAAPLRIGVLSKSARGYALLDGESEEAVKAGPSPVAPGMDVTQAFLAIVGDCVSQFRRNEAILLRTPSPEAVHQARVALRRLRSAFTLFRDLIAHPRSGEIAGEVKWLAGALGEARDFDVLIKNYAAKRDAEDGEDPSAFPERLKSGREGAYEQAIAALRSRRALDLMIDLTEWATAGAWRQRTETAELRRRPIEGFAAEVLEKRLARLKKKSKALAKLDPERRHQARIEAKKLRYASDFFGPLFAGGKLKTFSKRLAKLQDELGDLNDIERAQGLTFEVARKAGAARDGSSAFAAGRFAGRAESAAPDLVEKAEKRLSKLKKAKPFWR